MKKTTSTLYYSLPLPRPTLNHYRVGMEQAGVPLISTIISRVDRLETDVSIIKKEQCAHSNQIETLALEVHEINKKTDRLEKKFNVLEGKFDIMQSKLDLILNALAIKI